MPAILKTALILLLFSNISPTYLSAQKDQLFVGWSVAIITPDQPVALTGQLHKRISESVNDPLTATVLAIETTDEKGTKEQAIMVSCDLLWIRAQTQKKLQDVVSEKLTDFNASKLFLNATHTHTAPGLIDGEFFGLYDAGEDEDVIKPSDYEAFFIEKTSAAIAEAWNNRQPGGFSWGLGNALLNHNRRTVKTDGTSKMYGVNDADFSHYESTQDNRVQMLFLWNQSRSLTGIVINSATTAQVTGGAKYVSADFYHETRESLKRKYGENINVLFQVGAAGDVVPFIHEHTYRKAERIMLERKEKTFRQELADRLIQAIDEVMPHVKNDIEYSPVFKHTVAKVYLPVKDPPAPPFYMTDDVRPAEIHVIRLGDIAIATNPFELFIDYGIRIKARSKAALTFIVQLSSQHSGYLPTERAAKGGGYSAEKYLVGPDGGNKLVDETLSIINNMWD